MNGVNLNGGVKIKQERNLNKGKIISAALAILETNGLEKMSMRQLAASLGFQVSAIYNHFENKQDLICALQAYYLSPKNQKYPINYKAKTWQEFLQSIAVSSRLRFTHYPHILELFATHSSESKESVRNFEIYMKLMHKFGFNSLQAGQISQTIYIYIVGFCNFENNVKKSSKAQSKQTLTNNITLEYPLTNQFMTDYGWDFDRDYAFGIKTLIKGFAEYYNE